MTVAAEKEIALADRPALLAYSAGPHRYFDEQAAAVGQLYDGLFFTVGSWDEGLVECLGLAGPPVSTPWAAALAQNLSHLAAAGVSTNILTVHFSEGAPWPSAETLLDAAYLAKMVRHFRRLGASAAAMGCHGVAIDVEYPYPRYSLEHESYTYDGYTAADLLGAAGEQGRAAVGALLESFPSVAVFVLPGTFRCRPIERAFLGGMLAAMAERNAPGGLHLGCERSYCLHDPATQVGIAREADCWAALHLAARDLTYWRRCCTVAPGVWPLHMVETGAKNYPVRPWVDELGELGRQLTILDRVAKRYLWSFTAHPVWYDPGAPTDGRLGMPRATFPGAEEAVRGWQQLLRERRSASPSVSPALRPLLQAVTDFDAGRIDGATLCDRFATPAAWMVLGPLGNPFTAPAFSVPPGEPRPLRPEVLAHGRDGVVRWFPYREWDPTGQLVIRRIFDWRHTDQAAAQLVCAVHCERDVPARLSLGWDDGLAVWWDGALIFDRRAYGRAHGGLLHRDRLLFEERVSLMLRRGEHRLAVSSLNAMGEWGFNLRFTGEDDLPAPGLHFSLAAGGA